MIKRVCCFLLPALFLCLATGQVYANVAELARSDAWRALVHYRPSIIGVRSTIDSDDFFLSPNGKTNPEAELNATIDLFMGTDVDRQCLMPARYAFLKKNGLVSTAFPSCPAYEEFRRDLNPAGLTLLYTDAYMNNPSSLFGHTLLRIDIPEGRTQLVAHGVNYGANVAADENGVLFAFWGLTGGYFGSFTVKPYYTVIRMYNNIENRDIWEFKLDLTDAELDTLVAHLWELGHTQTRYFFFTENCSYMLMEILDAVRPSLKLADDFPVQAIPLDTVKAVAKREGFVKNVQYRPSRQQRIMNRYDRFSAKQMRAVRRWLDGQNDYLDDLSKRQQAEILDVAYEYVQYQWEAQKIDLKTYRGQSFEVLRARRDLPEVTKDAVRQKASPLTAHDSARMVLSYGWRNGSGFQELAVRPAYHSLTDNARGMLAGAEINFLNTKIRHYNHENRAVLQGIDIVEITSVSPWNNLFQPISYNIKTSINREHDLKRDEEGYVYNLKGGAGAAVQILPSTMAFGYVNTGVKYGGFVPHNAGIGIGPMVGFLTHYSDIQIMGTAEYIWSDNYFMKQINVAGEAVYSMTQNVALALEYDWLRMASKVQNEIKLGVRLYF